MSDSGLEVDRILAAIDANLINDLWDYLKGSDGMPTAVNEGTSYQRSQLHLSAHF